MAKGWEWYYPKPHKLAREIPWNLGPREVQYNGGVPLRPLPRKNAKAPPWPRTRLREGHGKPRMESEKETRVMDLHSYSAFFARTPDWQAQVDRRMREDLERIAAKETEIEAK